MERIYNTEGTDLEVIFEQLESVRRSSADPNEFWPSFLEISARLISAPRAFLLVRKVEGGSWKRISVWSDGQSAPPHSPEFKALIDGVAEATVHRGSVAEKGLDNRNSTGTIVGVRLRITEAECSAAVFIMGSKNGLAVDEAILRLNLIADTPAFYELGRIVRQAKRDVVGFAEALDLMVLLNTEKRYMAAAMTFCNEIASRYKCDRTSLGWIEGAYVRIQAISQMEKFEKKMNVIQSLEMAMEEAFDQDEEIVWPRPPESQFVARDHEAFSKERKSENVVSLPMRVDDDAIGVLTCERSGQPFSEEEVWGLRVLCDQSVRRLADLKYNDRWFGARLLSAFKETLSKLLGVEHTLWKLLGISLSIALLILIFGKMEYRIESPVILKTDELAYLPAPFDAYISGVNVKVGDSVTAKEPLLSLDTRELLLEESNMIATQNRYQREAEKARAQNALADMKVAMALQDQSKARLKLIRHHLANSQLRAPFSGIVVEGGLQELLGSPVRKGDILLKVAKVEKVYVELKVNERDIHELVIAATGEIALVSRPELKFPIQVQRIDPVAIAEEDGNVFLVRADFPEGVQPWLRPGMSGIAKINVGPRNILWVFTHRTIDFLRLFLWW